MCPQLVRNTTFAFFNSTECGQTSAAVAINPSQVDFFPPMSFSGIRYHTVEESSRFALGRSATTAVECTGAACDSYDFTIISDDDGSVTGLAGRYAACARCVAPSLSARPSMLIAGSAC